MPSGNASEAGTQLDERTILEAHRLQCGVEGFRGSASLVVRHASWGARFAAVVNKRRGKRSMYGLTTYYVAAWRRQAG